MCVPRFVWVVHFFLFFHPPHSLPPEGGDTKGAAYQFVPSTCNGPRIKRLRQKNVHPNERFTESYVWSSTVSTRFHEKLHSPALKKKQKLDDEKITQKLSPPTSLKSVADSRVTAATSPPSPPSSSPPPVSPTRKTGCCGFP